ncbi:uncharacterized protein F5891DRAFT_1246968 [Suillus fuscotomentosus]|uniref:Uncharacterized protein n=1 Tax=Suillus fuscotomentosus TaxID=1912939 RepID=A0AAD4E196_9AGAM|nr:uncharacterized protein F5891DRAFT_1246968 [Suillus fuscotomentosus]KAG1896433.1 hypothetical protein F5891DRAFT_1246968 [Suillus fuscotomentosus]
MCSALSKNMGDKLDKEKGRESIEAPDFKRNASTDLIRQRAVKRERSTPTKPDLRPSAEFREGRRRRRGDGSSGTNHASLDALSTHEELDILKVEHSHTFSSQTCALQDLQTQEKDLRSQFEVAVWEKAEKRTGSLMDEVAKLRRMVHEMQQTIQSAVAQGAGLGLGLGFNWEGVIQDEFYGQYFEDPGCIWCKEGQCQFERAQQIGRKCDGEH